MTRNDTYPKKLKDLIELHGRIEELIEDISQAMLGEDVEMQDEYRFLLDRTYKRLDEVKAEIKLEVKNLSKSDGIMDV